MRHIDVQNLIHHPMPWTSAHRAGNSIHSALEAVRAGADLLETDVWLHKGELELRHPRTLGPIPFLWERWKLSPGWKPRLHFSTLLRTVPESILLFLDLKGDDLDIGPAIVEERDRIAPERVIAVCGRNYPMLDAIADLTGVVPFYSVGEEQEWPAAMSRLETMTYPALSLHARLATPERMDQLNAMGVTVVCWSVNDPTLAERLAERGVAGFTTDNLELVRDISSRREPIIQPQ